MNSTSYEMTKPSATQQLVTKGFDGLSTELPESSTMRTRARYYQSLFDSGEVKTRAEVARYLGVSRARVTQVLKRLVDAG